MAKMRPQMVIVWLTTLQKCITTWDPFRKFNLWIRPLIYVNALNKERVAERKPRMRKYIHVVAINFKFQKVVH